MAVKNPILATYQAKVATSTQQGQPLGMGTMLPIASILTDEGTQARAGMDGDTIEAYAQDMLGGATFPPIVVFHSGASYWLADGFHRVAAAKKIGHTSIRADVRMGDKRAAILYAVGANDTHGLRRTNEDKRRAIAAMLKDEEWRQWSDSAIGQQVRADHKTVAAVRAKLVATGEIPGSSIRQSADGKLRDVSGIVTSNERRKSTPAAHAPRPAEPAAAIAPARRACPTCQQPILNGLWGDLHECGSCYQARMRAAAPAPPARPPAAEPDDDTIIAQMREIRARTAPLGLEIIQEDDQVCLYWPGEDLDDLEPMSYTRALAWLRDEAPALRPIAHANAESAGRAITLALTDDDCAALRDEARVFAASELSHTLPTIAQVLALLIGGMDG